MSKVEGESVDPPPLKCWCNYFFFEASRDKRALNRRTLLQANKVFSLLKCLIQFRIINCESGVSKRQIDQPLCLRVVFPSNIESVSASPLDFLCFP